MSSWHFLNTGVVFYFLQLPRTLAISMPWQKAAFQCHQKALSAPSRASSLVLWGCVGLNLSSNPWIWSSSAADSFSPPRALAPDIEPWETLLVKAKTKKAWGTLTLPVPVITDLVLSLRLPCLSFAVHVATGVVLVAFDIACAFLVFATSVLWQKLKIKCQQQISWLAFTLLF